MSMKFPERAIQALDRVEHDFVDEAYDRGAILAQWPVEVQAGDTAEPHRLASYVYAVADAYTTFHENCPVLKAPDDETKTSRLALCAATMRTSAARSDST